MTGPNPFPVSRHVPERTCVACRRKRPQTEFRRVSRVDGEWTLVAGHRTGRGAYVCADSPACWQDKRLRRAFGAQAPDLSARLNSSD
ncbi:YlxR family protein [Deinococcus sp. KSM4-11]|uniref:YlxR family protein n=1 Tax=Deinococcus sp. KSM4-11 TaxID=2568654 RepID=UPI0010A47481|nr:YlxR family protein [Deinococcus sp. KSM4-11]THF88772.1 YlxR family protein [Deinococcus sp. KSM4-11]